MDTPEETKKRASLLIRAGEVAGGVQDEAAIRKAFLKKVKANAGRSAGEVHTPSKSGLTLGFGHDIGQATEAEIDRFYGSGFDPRAEFQKPAILSESERNVLKQYVGQHRVKLGKGTAAFKATTGIDVTYEEATEVFEKELLPKYIEVAKTSFPGFEDLPAKQQAAIVNRVYMRGGAPNKSEGKKGYKAWVQLHTAIFKRDTKEVYLALKNMERLHKNSKLSSSTQGRARTNTALAYEGYLETTRMGPR